MRTGTIGPILKAMPVHWLPRVVLPLRHPGHSCVTIRIHKKNVPFHEHAIPLRRPTNKRLQQKQSRSQQQEHHPEPQQRFHHGNPNLLLFVLLRFLLNNGDLSFRQLRFKHSFRHFKQS